MIAEFIVGRHGASNAARAYYQLGGRWWSVIGYMGAITSMIILGFYAVIAGWCLQYLVVSLMGGIHGDPAYVASYFKTFSSNPVKPLLWTVAFIVLTHLVVIRGVRKGIEKFSNMLMPTLFILLLVIVVASCLLPGAGKGIVFLFKPDFSKINNNVLLDALGQSFFSLSLGTACLCTYASYFSRQTNLSKSALQIAGIDTLIAGVGRTDDLPRSVLGGCASRQWVPRSSSSRCPMSSSKRLLLCWATSSACCFMPFWLWRL